MRKLFCFLATGVFLLCTTCVTDPIDFAPELQREKSNALLFPQNVEDAIVSGIEWLLLPTTQNPDGSFGTPWDEVAKTALAVTKLCDRSVELGSAPLEGIYATDIKDGLNYIFQHAVDNPDGGIYLSTNDNHSLYNTGIAMMAVAAARCPGCVVAVSGSEVDGMSFSDVLQVTVNFFVAEQNSDGGWVYYDLSNSDNSNTGFAVLGLLAAEGAGIGIPQSLKNNLIAYIDFIQNDVSGGSGYTDPNDWVNTLKTGNLLFEMAFVGDAPNAPRVLHALEYIETNWNENNPDPGWRNNSYVAMYSLMKGFVSMDIETIIVEESVVNWYDDFVLEILDDLGDPHNWPLPGGYWTDPYLASVFSLLTLEKITPKPIIPVDIDVKPTSCPNPLNRGSKGVIPVAILGTDEFDVNTIDPTTVNIGEVYAVKWSYEKVATPYDGGFSEPINKMDCNTEEPDDYEDLVLHFPSSEIADLFVDNDKKDVILIRVDGQLVNDGLPIIGEDVMVIVK